jgi:hypothetical protein
MELVGIRVCLMQNFLTTTVINRVLKWHRLKDDQILEYFVRCPEIVHTIDQDKAEISTDMSRIKRVHNQLAYNIEIKINITKYIIDEITIRDQSMINVDMLLGLRFLQYSVQTTIIHKQGITFCNTLKF